MTSSFFLVAFLLFGLASRPTNTKTLEVKEGDERLSLKSLLKDGLLIKLNDAMGSKASIADSIMGLFAKCEDKDITVILSKKFPFLESFGYTVKETIKGNKDFLKPFINTAIKMKKLNENPDSKSGILKTTLNIIFDRLISQDEQLQALDEDEPGDADSLSGFQNQLINMAMKALTGNLGDLESTLMSPTLQTSTEMVSLNSTYSSMWMIVKSTWQRLLAYVEEENSLETFMKLTPVKIVDNIISLGDELNLMNFLAKKLDKSLAEFLASEVNPYLGPLKDFNTFYNFTKENGLSSVVDYVTSERFTYTLAAISRFVSAYLENTVSDDIVNQYIEFISFNNTELHNFYKSFLNTQSKTPDQDNLSDTSNNNVTQRFKRDVLESIASSYMTNPDSNSDTYADPIPIAPRQLHQRFGVPNPLGLSNSLYDPSRDGGYGGGHSGGYGGGGYGGGYSMNTLDPYMILGALALGTILGFLLFRALRGTGGGRRDIGDGSLSLWDSDLPDQMLPWGSSVERMKRQVDDNTHSFSLPPSLRGDVWSSDPTVTDNLLDDHLDEDDIAHHLNHLWHLYRDTNETACVHSHLCHVMANTTAHHLTGKDSSLALFMASLGNMLGAGGSGQLVDGVTSSLVVGTPVSCPSFATCHPM